MLKKIAIIPARGGSKRIPRKNIKKFLSKPILVYSIDAALESGLFDEVMVSTDDPEIAEIAKFYGAKVPFFRNVVNSNDYATTFDVLKEVLDKYKERGETFAYGCCIYPTAPFTSSFILKKFSEYLDATDFDCVFPVLKYGYPIQRGLRMSKNGQIEMLNKEHLTTRSQDLEPTYHDAGQFYWFRVNELLEKGALVTDNTGSLVINEIQAQDIDNEEDWEIAEFKYKFLQDKFKKS